MRRMPRLQCETLYTVGGLYGNAHALAAVQKRIMQEEQPEHTHVVFNGDFKCSIATPVCVQCPHTCCAHRYRALNCTVCWFWQLL